MPDDILFSIRDLTVEYTTRAGTVQGGGQRVARHPPRRDPGAGGRIRLREIDSGQGSDAPAYRTRPHHRRVSYGSTDAT